MRERHRGDIGFAAGIADFLDVEAFLRFIAANALLANLDSYLAYGHNDYLYLHPGSDRFVFIPWDLDLSLATWPAAGTPDQRVELSLDHPHAGADRLVGHLTTIEGALREPRALEAWAMLGRGEGAVGGLTGNGQFGGSLPPREFIRRRPAAVHDQLEGRSQGFRPRPVGFGPPPWEPPAVSRPLSVMAASLRVGAMPCPTSRQRSGRADR